LATDWTIEVRFPEVAENFSLHHRVQNGSGADPASYPMDTRGSFSGAKRPGHESDHSPPSSDKVNEYVFMAWCLVKHSCNFTFTFCKESRAGRKVQFQEQQSYDLISLEVKDEGKVVLVLK
jgi:hypothetical protein